MDGDLDNGPFYLFPGLTDWYDPSKMRKERRYMGVFLCCPGRPANGPATQAKPSQPENTPSRKEWLGSIFPAICDTNLRKAAGSAMKERRHEVGIWQATVDQHFDQVGGAVEPAAQQGCL